MANLYLEVAEVDQRNQIKKLKNAIFLANQRINTEKHYFGINNN